MTKSIPTIVGMEATTTAGETERIKILAMKNTTLLKLWVGLALAIVAFVLAGCNRNTNNGASAPPESSATQTTSEPTPLSAFERDLQDVRNSQFTYVWVFSRKDGKPLDKADSDYLRTNAPQVVDWVSSDLKKAVGGTNFDLEQGNLNLLKKRFVVEDYSKK